MPVVASITILGTNAQVNLATQVGQAYNDTAVEKDVRDLWNLGLFEDIRVETTPQADGVAVVFRLVPSPDLRLHDLRIEPSSYNLRLLVPEGTQINRARAFEVAREAKKQLRAQGYNDAEVDYDLIPFAGNSVSLRLRVRASQRVRVKEVEFSGDLGLYAKELRGALTALRTRQVIPPIPGVWKGWRLLPGYSQEAADSDLARLRSLYLSNGYLDAAVGVAAIEIDGADARISIHVQSGPRGPWRPGDLCSPLLAERRKAEREGIMDFDVKLDGPFNTAIHRGQPYRVGRINFIGSRHYSDLSIRRNFVLDEGAVFDERLLRRSLARLTQTGRFEPFDASDVIIRPNENTGEADVALRLRERKSSSWSLSGPVGPMSIGGPLQASISTRLPAFSTYVASISLLAFSHPILPLLAVTSKTSGILTALAIRRPFSPGEGWRSGFLIAPQLGWRFSALTYATTQIQQRALPLLAGDRGLVAELPVIMETAKGEEVMYCKPPDPRFSQVRNTAAFGLRLLGGLAGL